MIPMAENKKSFILYACWIERLEELSNTDAGILFKAVLRYVNGKKPFVISRLQVLFDEMTEQIETEWRKFNPKTEKYHWNYKGGITPENRSIRNSAEYELWRIKIFERDGYTCQNCFQVGSTLHAHHIKEFAQYTLLRFEVSNGITVCKDCHIRIHKKKSQCQTEC